MLIEFTGEDDSRVGFRKGDRVEVDDQAAFPHDFRKVEVSQPNPQAAPPVAEPDDNKEGE